MKIFTLIGHAVVILTLAVIVLSLFAVLNRFLGELRESYTLKVRRRIHQSLDGFVAGSIGIDTVAAEFGKNREIALDVMVEVASRFSPAARASLRELFAELQFPAKEMAALRSRRWPVRVRAATRLAYMDDPRAIPELTRALWDEMLDVRLAAARALAELESVESVTAILRALALPAGWPLQRCAEILYGMGTLAIDPLLAFVAGERADRSDAALSVSVRVLGMLRVRRAATQVSHFLHDANAELRLCAAKALGEMGDTQVLPALCAALDDRAWEVRSAVVQALGRLGDSAAVPALHELLADSAWWVRFNAATSLCKLGPAGRSALRHAMTSHRDRFARDIARQVLEEQGDLPVAEARYA